MASLTQMSMGPSSRSTRSAAASTAAASVTSTETTRARPPAASTSRAAAASPSSPRASRATRAPSRPKATAVARPTPAAAPVTTMTLSRRLAMGPLEPQDGADAAESGQVLGLDPDDLRALPDRRLHGRFGDVVVALDGRSVDRAALGARAEPAAARAAHAHAVPAVQDQRLDAPLVEGLEHVRPARGGGAPGADALAQAGQGLLGLLALPGDDDRLCRGQHLVGPGDLHVDAQAAGHPLAQIGV